MENIMSRIKNSGKPDGGGDRLPAVVIFRLLANEQRLRTLQYLSRSVGTVKTKDIADYLTILEGNHTREQFERMCTSLVHVHIPALVDASVVEYDPANETVRLLDVAGDIAPYLELADRTPGQ